MNNPFVGVSSYRTDNATRPGALVLAFPSLVFYPRILGIVYGSNRLARAGRYDGPAWIDYSLRVVRALESVGVKVGVEGLDKVDALDGPAVFAANHMSTLETFVLPSILRPRGEVTFVVKKSLLGYPLFGEVLKACAPIAVGRANPREDLAAVMGEGVEKLKKGCSVIVFPQTTRTNDFDPSKFNSIGAKLAARAGVKLVPVALRTNAWGNGRLVKDIGPVDPSLPVDFVFGEAIPPEGKGDSAHRATVEFIQGVFDRWKGAR